MPAGAEIRIILVLDEQAGERLEVLSREAPVWAPDSVVNRAVAQRAWADTTRACRLTLFNAVDMKNWPKAGMEVVMDIDEHALDYSIRERFSCLEVIGRALSDQVKAWLAPYGFVEFRETASGFVARRPPEPLDYLPPV